MKSWKDTRRILNFWLSLKLTAKSCSHLNKQVVDCLKKVNTIHTHSKRFSTSQMFLYSNWIKMSDSYLNLKRRNHNSSHLSRENVRMLVVSSSKLEKLTWLFHLVRLQRQKGRCTFQSILIVHSVMSSSSEYSTLTIKTQQRIKSSRTWFLKKQRRALQEFNHGSWSLCVSLCNSWLLTKTKAPTTI